MKNMVFVIWMLGFPGLSVLEKFAAPGIPPSDSTAVGWFIFYVFVGCVLYEGTEKLTGYYQNKSSHK